MQHQKGNQRENISYGLRFQVLPQSSSNSAEPVLRILDLTVSSHLSLAGARAQIHRAWERMETGKMGLLLQVRRQRPRDVQRAPPLLRESI